MHCCHYVLEKKDVPFWSSFILERKRHRYQMGSWRILLNVHIVRRQRLMSFSHLISLSVNEPLKQECIPVGCVLPASMVISGWGCLPRGRVVCLGRSASEPGGCTHPGRTPHWTSTVTPPIACWDTHPPPIAF